MSKIISIIDRSGEKMFLQCIDYFTGECVFTNDLMDAAKYINDEELLSMDCALIHSGLGFVPEIINIKYKFI